MRVIVCAYIWPENSFCGGDGSPNKPTVLALCVVRACRGMERLIKLRMVFSSLKKAKTFFFPSSCWLAVVWQKSMELGGRDGGSGADRCLLCLSPVVVQKGFRGHIRCMEAEQSGWMSTPSNFQCYQFHSKYTLLC